MDSASGRHGLRNDADMIMGQRRLRQQDRSAIRVLWPHLSTILATRDAPRPLRKLKRVVDA